jgi:hypothetical protein
MFPAALTDRGEDLDHFVNLLHRKDLFSLPHVPWLSSRYAFLGLDGWPRPGFRCEPVRGRRFRGIGGVLGNLSYLTLQFCYLASNRPTSSLNAARRSMAVQARDKQDMQSLPESWEKSATTIGDNRKRNRKSVAIWRDYKRIKGVTVSRILISQLSSFHDHRLPSIRTIAILVASWV